MNEMTRAELDEILLEFVATDDLPDWTAVQEWMQRYPKYAHEIAEFAAAWILSETMPANAETAAMSQEHWLDASRRGFERAVAESRAEYAPATLTSLVKAAQNAGKDLAALAGELQISEPLLLKLERRLLTASTIPTRFIGELARALHTSTESVSAYLTQPARLATGAQYRAEKAPRVQAQESFAQAIQNDRSMSQAERERLLAMTEGSGSGPR